MTRYFDQPSDPKKWRNFWKLLNQEIPELRPTTPDHQWQYQVIAQLQEEVSKLRQEKEEYIVTIRNLRDELDEFYDGILIR